MEFTEEQKQKIRDWLADGASLSDVQSRIQSEFGQKLTYLDVRMLVLDIGATVKDKEEPKKPEPKKPAAESDAADTESADGQAEEDEGEIPDEEEQGIHPAVSLTLDKLVVPGAMVSGDVSFSDGKKGRWLIDQYGQFGLDMGDPNYRPSEADLREFQIQLRKLLHQHGYM
ncbi:MAG: hypothetical protein IKR48_08100 [Kiritimatiellae bacterium]|nr:hypothetical protein [Kiritimatiellia bacterium]